MQKAYAFDIYGTLINPHGVISRLQEYMGEPATEFSRVWREKQLEYTFRRGLMGQYQDFRICTQQALDYADSVLQAGLSQEQKSSLLAEYRQLPAFDDVQAGLSRLKAAGHPLYAFSNGVDEDIEALLESAGISSLFNGIVSVDSLQTFKPDPKVYQHMINTAGLAPANTWLVSSNPFDIIGAENCGMKTAWVQRSTQVQFDPWGVEPTTVVTSLTELEI